MINWQNYHASKWPTVRKNLRAPDTSQLLAEWSAKLIPLTGPKRERYGEGIERGVIGPSGGPALSAKLAWGGTFFCLESLC